MKSISLRSLLSLGLLTTLFAACENKEFEDIAPPARATGNTAAAFFQADTTNYRILNAALNRTGLMTTLGQANGNFTIFAPNDAAFTASGLSLAAVNALPLATLTSILSYHVIPQRLPSSAIPTTYPNVQMPSLLTIPAPNTNPLLKFNIFPSRSNGFFVNNIPVTTADIPVLNGVIHNVPVLVSPPTMTVKSILRSDSATFSILLNALVRADSGQVDLNRLDSVIDFVPANVTLYAPTNAAFRLMFPPGTSDAAIIGALRTPALFPAQTVRGLMAYHLMGVRAFSVNNTNGAVPRATLLNLPTTPPTNVPVVVIYNNATTPATFQVKGLANATPSNVTTRDRHAINGVVHVIDQVMRPQ